MSAVRPWLKPAALSALAVLAAGAFALGAYTARARLRPVEVVAALPPLAPLPPPPLAALPPPAPTPSPPLQPAPPPVPQRAPPPAPQQTPPPEVVVPQRPVPPPENIPPPRLVVPRAPTTVGGYRVGELIEQEVTVTRRAVFRTLGVGVPQAAEYVFTSRLTVEAIAADGTLTVKQRVEATRLVSADPDTRAMTEDALKATRGSTFEITVNPAGEVTALKGVADPVRVQPLADPFGGGGFRVSSLLDADGWKELAGLTFFQPPRPAPPGGRWAKPLAHSWGPLGSWAGQTRYAAVGADRYDYAHEMVYRPPAAGGALPFRIARADLRVLAAAGAVRYDAARGRVTAAEEAFRVVGAMTISIAGLDAPIELDEAQQFRLRVTAPR